MALKPSARLSPRKRPEDSLPSETSDLREASAQFVLEQTATAMPAEFLPLGKPPGAINVTDLILSELNAARLLNVEMPAEPNGFIRLLEARIREITGTHKNAILILDEDSGTYTCLNDQTGPDETDAPRELTWISDHYLQDLLASDQVIHSFLHHQGNVFGIVAIADKHDGSAFNQRDEILLEQLTQYLSVQVNHFLVLKRTMMLPTIQRILLDVSNRLLCAVDSEAILRGTMDAVLAEMPFSAAQYISLNRKNGKGHILTELHNGQFHHGEALRDVSQFASLLSLFQSQVWQHPYLYLKGTMLGDKRFSELFGLPDIASVLMCPMSDERGDVCGALVFFQQGKAVPLAKEALQAIEQVPALVAAACNRAGVLEKALLIATTDELTETVNRRGLFNRLDAEIDRARRNQSPMCVAMLDLDHFKVINDTYGHLTGDTLLRQLARHIQKNIRKSDLLSRYGGEEFVLILPETTPQAAFDLVERLREKIARTTFQTPTGPVRITFSAGIAQFQTTQHLSDEASHIISQCFAHADGALYESKLLGRNQVRFAS